jgi:hypothetical protein
MVAWLLFAGGAGPGRVLPGVARVLRLDLNTLFAGVGLGLGSAGSVDLALAVPADPSLAGVEIHSQALVVTPAGGAPRLSQPVGTRVLR